MKTYEVTNCLVPKLKHLNIVLQYEDPDHLIIPFTTLPVKTLYWNHKLNLLK